MASPRIISILLALVLTGFVYLAMSFLPEISDFSKYIVSLVIFISSLVLYYFTIEVFVAKETNKILARLKNLSLELVSSKKIKEDANPLKKLNTQLSKYVSAKENEIATLKQQEAYRKELIANISHELKTPLFTAQGFVNTLIDGALHDENVAEDFLNKASKSLDNLEKLVSDILVMSKAEWDELNLDFAKLNLKSLIKEVIEDLQLLADQKSIKVIKKIEIKGPIWVIVDEDSMRQILKNLIENALRYSGDNSKVVVNVSIEGKQVLVAIEDNGPGISAGDKDRIFERFYRVEKSRSRATGGTGLGLAIVKHLLVLHNSQIKLKSEIGEGAVFSFKLDKVWD